MPEPPLMGTEIIRSSSSLQFYGPGTLFSHVLEYRLGTNDTDLASKVRFHGPPIFSLVCRCVSVQTFIRQGILGCLPASEIATTNTLYKAVFLELLEGLLDGGLAGL